MAIIQDIPNEILCDILSLLRGQDLHATSLVSHRFYTIAQSPLYRKPYLYLNGANRLCNHAPILANCGLSPVPGPVTLFLRTLLLAPGRENFAHYVRTLTMAWDNLPQPRISIPDIALLTMAALNLGFDDHPLTEHDAQIVLLLRLLPRLTALELRDVAQVGCFGSQLLRNVLMSPKTIPVGLRNIHEFTCRGTYSSAGVTPQILVGLLGLPSIDKITVSITDNRSENEAFTAAAATAAGTSPLTNLTLYSRDITTSSLESLLKIPKSLTSFCYTSKNGLSDTSIVNFFQALVPLQSSLQCLKIYYIEMPHFYYIEPKNKHNSTRTFRGCKALHTLSLQMLVLLGVPDEASPAPCLADLLPLSLCTLFVYDDFFWSGGVMVDQLIGVLERGDMVVLRKLSVMMSTDDVTEEMVERLERACCMADVKLEWNQNGLY